MTPPIVLSIAGHDPTGGAGLQADIEAITALGCHACSLITCLTAQDTLDVHDVFPQSVGHFLKQANRLMADVNVGVIKIGLLGSVEIALAVSSLLDLYPHLPVVLDPILSAGGGRSLSTTNLEEVMRKELLPRVTLITPNTIEARRLSGLQGLEESSEKMLQMGVPNILITGTHDDGVDVINRWFSKEGVIKSTWPRLPGNFHGSGCTLASSIASYLALGKSMSFSIAEGQSFTWESLRKGFPIGKGQLIPRRSFGSGFI